MNMIIDDEDEPIDVESFNFAIDLVKTCLDECESEFPDSKPVLDTIREMIEVNVEYLYRDD